MNVQTTLSPCSDHLHSAGCARDTASSVSCRIPDEKDWSETPRKSVASPEYADYLEEHLDRGPPQGQEPQLALL